KGGVVDQLLEGSAGNGELRLTGAFLHAGKLAGGECGEGEAAAATGDQDTSAILTEVNIGAVRQGFTDIHQLAGRDGDLAGLPGLLEIGTADDFHLQVRPGKGQPISLQTD